MNRNHIMTFRVNDKEKQIIEDKALLNTIPWLRIFVTQRLKKRFMLSPD